MVAVQPPPQRIPIVDPETGMPSFAFRDFIERLWQRAGGAGEVVLPKGPATSTDNAITRYDGTAGDVQNSGVLIDDLDNITNHAIKVETIADGDWSGASSFDYADGPVKTATRTSACTPSVTNWPVAGEAKVTLELTQGAGAVTWTNLVDKWLGGSVPTLSDTSGAVDVVIVTTIDGGTTKLGAHIGAYT